MEADKKDKSLSLIGKKFLSYYPYYITIGNEPIVIQIDQVLKKMEIKRRRIYDVINVLESIEVVSKKGKNEYIWNGFNNIHHLLTKLKTFSVKSGFIEYAKVLMASQFDSPALNQVNSQFSSSQNPALNDKSLGIMTQKFLMLFLTSEMGIVSINFAAKVLIGDSKIQQETSQKNFKNKIRRLYDIANVLSSASLICKNSNKIEGISKPSYEYIGPAVAVDDAYECGKSFINSSAWRASKHSIFDQFKLEFEPNSSIPKFDIFTGAIKSTSLNQPQSASQLVKQEPLNLNEHTVNSNAYNYHDSYSSYAVHPGSLASKEQLNINENGENSNGSVYSYHNLFSSYEPLPDSIQIKEEPFSINEYIDNSNASAYSYHDSFASNEPYPTSLAGKEEQLNISENGENSNTSVYGYHNSTASNESTYLRNTTNFHLTYLDESQKHQSYYKSNAYDDAAIHFQPHQSLACRGVLNYVAWPDSWNSNGEQQANQHYFNYNFNNNHYNDYSYNNNDQNCDLNQ